MKLVIFFFLVIATLAQAVLINGDITVDSGFTYFKLGYPNGSLSYDIYSLDSDKLVSVVVLNYENYRALFLKLTGARLPNMIEPYFYGNFSRRYTRRAILLPINLTLDTDILYIVIIDHNMSKGTSNISVSINYTGVESSYIVEWMLIASIIGVLIWSCRRDTGQ